MLMIVTIPWLRFFPAGPTVKRREKLIEPFISSFWSADGKPGEITSNRFDRIAAEIPLSGDGIVICGPVEVETYLSVHFKVIESDQPPDHIIDNLVGIANKIAPLAGPGGAAVNLGASVLSSALAMNKDDVLYSHTLSTEPIDQLEVTFGNDRLEGALTARRIGGSD